MIKLTTGKPGTGMSLNCPPRGVNGEAFRVAPSAEPGHVAGIVKKSNLDLTGMRQVKKGVTVSLAGFRYQVTRVNRGYFYGKPLAIFGVVYPDVPLSRMRCESVQVIA